ncbi:MAG TPA: PqqD family protein [bacterium]|nr:PqqD family protein [bacterium]
MKTYDPDAVPVKAGLIPSQNVDGEIFAITPEDGVLHNFNEVGSFIWNLIDDEKSVREIASKVLSEYEVAPDALKQDMIEFFSQLHKKGLIEYRR